MARRIRALRHWKQRFDPNAAFVWRKRTEWGDQVFEPGDPIPDEIIEEMGRTKLRRFWESHFVELAEFEDPDVLSGRPEKYAASEAEAALREAENALESALKEAELLAKSQETATEDAEAAGAAALEAISEAERVLEERQTAADEARHVADGLRQALEADRDGAEPTSTVEPQPTPEPLPDDVTVSGPGGGGWYTVTIGEDVKKVQGQTALDGLLEELRQAADAEAS